MNHHGLFQDATTRRLDVIRASLRDLMYRPPVSAEHLTVYNEFTLRTRTAWRNIQRECIADVVQSFKDGPLAYIVQNRSARYETLHDMLGELHIAHVDEAIALHAQNNRLRIEIEKLKAEIYDLGSRAQKRKRTGIPVQQT
ncbi:hypothetical protein AMAG_00034 [Allomyces macrogynus ATCC 38327]|uniref:Uncharacterized protein n=1 Tax=Allomyces macrogynus (strain ATCC 38327) TaxID=578462 RepID=A0A0L0RVD3_ALLM3|nr:hypothetical protein AMAG_00034 [Allomyces macrogynus ATCC 38327]|eukprot:KNE54030.1 hypothetical protein AMAG_00034 [Allomyces macrogynus ATCC 38327]